MASFKISAPGRIVLSGEHIAAYKKQFLATSLNLRTHLEFCELPNTSENIIRIEFLTLNLAKDIPLKDVKNFYYENVEDIISNPINLNDYVKYLITVVKCMWTTNFERFSLQMFFFLLYSVAHHEHLMIKPFHVKVSTDMLMGAGLGSSTSFAVCLAGCFLHWQRLQSGCCHTEFNDADLASIKKYTISCEKSMQEFAFPDVDAHICTYGQIAKCQRINHEIYFINSTDMVQINILLIDSNIHESKSVRAQQVATLNDTAHNFQSILNELEHEAITMHYYLNSLSSVIRLTHLYGDEHPNYNSLISKVMLCIDNNQRLLNINNLSTEIIENICEIARTHGLAGKLTGFGGNYVYIFLPPDSTLYDITNFSAHLHACHFNSLIWTTINSNGVRIVN
ncbi:mevalonate kinase-like [Nylanderia fulva]|uniref:mevalonate kinase-like n=1 Tax=Nylanderia fulva TaxID=613905 RepID=UPI0010FBBAAC|nr:mevalonate kinase-like [Nylanderia fulva]